MSISSGLINDVCRYDFAHLFFLSIIDIKWEEKDVHIQWYQDAKGIAVTSRWPVAA